MADPFYRKADHVLTVTTRATIRAATLRAHKAILALDHASIDQLIALYRDAADAIAARIRAAGGANDLIEIIELNALKPQVEAILKNLEGARNSVLREGIQQAADLGAMPFDAAAVAQGAAAPVSAAAMRISQDAVKFVTRFIANDGLQLSDRLWRIDRAARDTITGAIERAVVMGMGATEAAQALLSQGALVSRDITSKAQEASATRLSNQIKVKLTGDGSPMDNALRVMRTEINRAHGEAYIDSFIAHPDFGGLKFTLSPAHPRPDICDLLSTQNLHGLGPGVYPTRGSCPWPAHPNTISFIEPVFKDEVTDADRAGQQTQAEALAALSAERRAGVLGMEKAALFDKGKFRRDMLPAAFRA